MLGNRIDVDAQRDVNRSASREFRVAYHFLLLFSFRSSPTSFFVFLLLTGCLLGPAASNNVDRQCRRQSAQSMSACRRQLVSFSFRFSFFLHLCSCSYSFRFLSLFLISTFLLFPMQTLSIGRRGFGLYHVLLFDFDRRDLLSAGPGRGIGYRPA